MPICERCGTQSPNGFRFCGACGTSLGSASAPQETRKVVTVLFSDATGFTSLGERLDPEALRAIMRSYFKEIRATVERHGGTVEKFIGDAVMAVFGVPRLHEDDALRAVRAAAEIRERLPSVGQAVGLSLRFRTGVNTGIVFTGEGESLAVGDAVNVAARLEQAAEPGEILLGPETFRLVCDRVHAEPVEPLTMKGKSEPFPAHRLIGLRDDRAATQPVAQRPRLVAGPPAAIVGREDELAAAVARFGETAASGQPHLLTVVGEAGIGKSRLGQELIDALARRALVLIGRCLSYGEGIAFWPLREALTQAAGGESLEAIRGLLAHAEDADLAARVIASTFGLIPAEPVNEQVPWAFQRLFEAPRKRAPVLLVIEDAHWAEDPLLDLLEHLVERLAAPALVLCLARPELLERRPGWAGGRERFSSALLGPLSAEDAGRLLRGQSPGRPLGGREIAAILEAAEGNPLFVEQLLAMRADEGWTEREGKIPVTIRSVLAARLDRLAPAERTVVERAAVIGREFPPSAVTELLSADARPEADAHLRALTRRGLIGPAATTVAGQDQLSFRHILIRDVAYESTPKALRGELHERFADWLQAAAAGHDEFVGYHLEQAVRYRTELGQTGHEMTALAARAGDYLAAVGRRAHARGDANGAASLLGRADDLLRAAGEPRLDVLLDAARAGIERGDYEDGDRRLRGVLDEALRQGADGIAARASIELSALQAVVDPEASVEEMKSVARDAIAAFERVGDDDGLARALRHLAEAHMTQLRSGEMEEVLERALSHASAGEERARILSALALATVFGPRPVVESTQRCHSILDQAGDYVKVAAVADTMLAVVQAMDGRFDEARARWARSKRRLTELGMEFSVSILSMHRAWIELLAGTPANAEPELRDAYETLEQVGERSHLATVSALIGRLLCARGRHQEANHYLEVAEQCASPDDIVSHVLWRGTRSRDLARAGQAGPAEELADSAVALAGQTDFLMLHADALRDRAEVLAVLGRQAEADRDLELAGELYGRKGIRALVVAESVQVVERT